MAFPNSVVDVGAVRIATVQTKTGALTFNAGTFLDKGSQVFDVKAFGAVGDGIVDDTVSVQAALTAATAASGGRVFFPPGDYKVTATLTIGADNVRLFGAGPRSRLVRPAGVGGTQVIVKADTRTNVAVYDITIDAGTNNFAGEGAIFFRRCTTSFIERCVVSGVGANTPAISLDSATACRVAGNVITGGGYGIVAGTPTAETNETNDNLIIENVIRGTVLDSIFVTASLSSTATATKARRNVIANNVISGSGDAGIEAGIGTIGTVIEGNVVRTSVGPNILLRDSVEFVVSGNTCTDSTAVTGSYGGGIAVADQVSTFASAKGTITGNICVRNTGCGISIASNTTYVGRGFQVSNNHCEANSEHGISSLSNISSSYTGNVCIANTLNGMNVTAVAATGRGDNSITGNVCANNSGTAGIYSTGEYSVITGNRCYDDQGTKTQDYGINLASTQSNFCLVTANQLTGNLTSAINDAGTGNVKLNNPGVNGVLVTDDGAFTVSTAASLTVGDKLAVVGNVGFYNTFPAAKQAVAGSRVASPALASLLTALATIGLITDNTTV